MGDRELLRQYAESDSEEAFRKLVDRHLPMVYSVTVKSSGKTYKFQAARGSGVEIDTHDVAVFRLSRSRSEDRQRARELGVDDYLLKPSDPLKLPELAKSLHDRWLWQPGAPVNP